MTEPKFELPDLSGLPEGPWTCKLATVGYGWCVYDATGMAVCLNVTDAVARAIASIPSMVGEIERKSDMENIGSAVMEVLDSYKNHPVLDGWHPAQCPSEIITDLLNHVDENGKEIDRLRSRNAELRAALNEALAQYARVVP